MFELFVCSLCCWCLDCTLTISHGMNDSEIRQALKDHFGKSPFDRSNFLIELSYTCSVHVDFSGYLCMANWVRGYSRYMHCDEVLFILSLIIFAFTWHCLCRLNSIFLVFRIRTVFLNAFHSPDCIQFNVEVSCVLSLVVTLQYIRWIRFSLFSWVPAACCFYLICHHPWFLCIYCVCLCTCMLACLTALLSAKWYFAIDWTLQNTTKVNICVIYCTSTRMQKYLCNKLKQSRDECECECLKNFCRQVVIHLKPISYIYIHTSLLLKQPPWKQT